MGEELTNWTLASLYSVDGKEGAEDFFLLAKRLTTMPWLTVVDSRYGLHFTHTDEPDEFDANFERFSEYNKMYNRDKARFDAADIDGDEKLTETEFVLFKNPLKDDKINLQEYLNDWHVPPNKNDEDFIELETDRFNDEYDRNKDGFLTGDELLFWLSPDNTEIAIDEAEHLIDMCDEDEDEKLTPEEIVENHDLWVDSDATEYGAQLRHYDEL